MIQIPLYISLLVGVASLVVGYRVEGFPDLTRWMLVFGAVWAFAQWQRWRWFAAIGLLAALAAAGYGLWIGLPSGWMLAGVIGALFAWDLSDFERRLHDSAPEDAAALKRRHLVRLGFVALAGLSYSLIGMLVRWQVSREWIGYAAILSALGVAYILGRGKR